MIMRRSALWIVSFALAVGCLPAGSTTSPRASYGRAAGGLAFGVAAAAVNRAVTGDCWASCTLPDTLCNRKTGLCEKRERLEDIWVPTPIVTGEQGMGPAAAQLGRPVEANEEAADG